MKMAALVHAIEGSLQLLRMSGPEAVLSFIIFPNCLIAFRRIPKHWFAVIS